ncbi:hypothetical protein M9194_07940 [Vibrio sp. S4M6]|uniref:hypothetical protein n=1 Tax=Vibrio sinus TaxID=2946865 RepID=UPI00202A2886|nr:hypothetical protein [Vibrio sinus]MCL9781354.1 hypothetical protein [Vibrio sinus]
MPNINELLKQDPIKTLRKYPIIQSHPVPETGVRKLYFKYREDHFMYKKEDSSPSASPWYWLNWEPQNITKLTLGNECDFFITAQLAGCRVIINSNFNMRWPTVYHVAGDGEIQSFERKLMKKRTESCAAHTWREQVSEQRNIIDFGAVRKITSTVYDSTEHTYTYKGEGMNIIGVRRNHIWRFYFQKLRYVGYDFLVDYVGEIDMSRRGEVLRAPRNYTVEGMDSALTGDQIRCLIAIIERLLSSGSTRHRKFGSGRKEGAFRELLSSIKQYRQNVTKSVASETLRIICRSSDLI